MPPKYPKKVFSSIFEKKFTGELILTEKLEDKLIDKHKVYRSDLFDALSDPNRVVMKSSQKSPIPFDLKKSSGKVYEILCESEDNKVMFVVGRLFPDGKLLILTAYWANQPLQRIYYQTREVLWDE